MNGRFPQGRRLLPGKAGREITMKYFMSGTPLAGLERMMMDPSRRCDSSEHKIGLKEKTAPPARRSGKERK